MGNFMKLISEGYSAAWWWRVFGVGTLLSLASQIPLPTSVSILPVFYFFLLSHSRKVVGAVCVENLDRLEEGP